MDLLEHDKTNNMGVYRFVVNVGVYAVQEARDGDAILQPEDPVAPEGMSFVGWALEEGGAPLFVDADGDGQADPVIAGRIHRIQRLPCWPCLILFSTQI